MPYLHENTLFLHELVHSINNKILGTNIMLKLDMEKAFDHIKLSLFLICDILRNLNYGSSDFSIHQLHLGKQFFLHINSTLISDFYIWVTFLLLEDCIKMMLLYS